MTSLHRWKPAAAARTQLLLAALLWTGTGIGLAIAGALWCRQAPGAWPGLLAAGGLLLGLGKGQFALRRTGLKAAQRIIRRGDGTCLGGFLSWKSWLFVAAMMAMGAALRRSALPRPALGLIYVTVGTALLWGSRVFWLEWGRSGA